MAIPDYVKTVWVNNTTPAINATNLNHIETKIYELDQFCIPRVKRRSSNQTVNNSTTLVNDDTLLVTLEASGVWEVELRLIVGGSYNSDFKCDWVVSGGLTQYSQRLCACGSDQGTSAIYDTNGNFSARDLNVANTYHGGNAGSYGSSINEFFLVNTTTSGTLQFRWAQATAVAENTIVQSGSYMKVSKVRAF